MPKNIIVAIDGYSSCGKSTLAKHLGEKLHYVYVDSGAMYRAVSLYLLENNIDWQHTDEVIKILDDIHIRFKYNFETHKAETYLNDINVEQTIREMQVSSIVSPVSAIPEVRRRLRHQQQEIGKHKRIVMDGRDIGTAVFPHAELKIFVTADKEIRVKRRFEEMKSKGYFTTWEEITKNLEDRDHQDTHRVTNPLRRAEDAIILDNTKLNEEQQLEIALRLAEAKINE